MPFFISANLGEIDSCHGKPKNDIRRFIRHSGAAGTQNTKGLIGGFDDARSLVDFLSRHDGYNTRLATKVDGAGFRLIERAVKLHLRDDNWQGYLYKNLKSLFIV